MSFQMIQKGHNALFIIKEVISFNKSVEVRAATEGKQHPRHRILEEEDLRDSGCCSIMLIKR